MSGKPGLACAHLPRLFWSPVSCGAPPVSHTTCQSRRRPARPGADYMTGFSRHEPCRVAKHLVPNQLALSLSHALACTDACIIQPINPLGIRHMACCNCSHACAHHRTTPLPLQHSGGVRSVPSAVYVHAPSRLIWPLCRYINQPEPALQGHSVTVKADEATVAAMKQEASRLWPPALAALMQVSTEEAVPGSQPSPCMHFQLEQCSAHAAFASSQHSLLASLLLERQQTCCASRCAAAGTATKHCSADIRHMSMHPYMVLWAKILV